MEYRGPDVYDDITFFKNYMKRRNRLDSPNNIIEKPIMLELIGDVEDKKILDLGCGDGKFGVELLDNGCSSYEGIEGSEFMVKEAAKHLTNPKGKIYSSTMESWSFPKKKYDVVISRLALHYIEDLHDIVQKAYHSLKDSGKFIFSVQHPVLTSSIRDSELSSKKSNWIVDDYFYGGERIEKWIDKKVIKYHRTVEAYFQILKQAGFSITDLREGTPSLEEFEHIDEYTRRMRIPLFLLLSSRK